MGYGLRRRFASGLALLILFAVSALFIAPLVVTLTNSFMTENEISLNYSTKLTVFDIINEVIEKYINISLIPREASLSQYKEVLIYQPDFLVMLTNSLKITLPVVIGGALFSLLSAYGFTSWQWKYKEIVFFIYIVVMLLPLQAVLVPNYIVAERLNIKDSPLYLAIVLPGMFNPFGTFLLRQSMKTLPKAGFEAARIDGAGEFKIFWNIVLPQMKSGIAALIMLTFIEYWNIVEQAVIFIKEYIDQPLSVYLSRIAEGRVSLIFAASCVYMFPPLWALIFGQKDLEKGIELSGVK